jgi:dihydropyrimidinase
VIVDFVVRNGLVVTPRGSFPGGVAIDKGKIAALGSDAVLPQGREVFDAEGRYVTPGFIDAHTHQGLFYRFADDLRGQTKLAALGGVTTSVGIERSTLLGRHGVYVPRDADDVPSYASVYESARDDVNASSYIDYAFSFAILTHGHALEIERCVRDWGVTSFKFYMQYLGRADRWANAQGFPLEGFDEGTMFEAFEALGRIGRPALATIHAEDRRIERILRERVMHSGRSDLRAWAEVCAPICEIAAIRQAALLARRTRAALYVVHLSASDALAEISWAREEGTDLTVEVNVPWLCVSVDEDPPGVYGKFLPPLRDRENLERLWEGLRSGEIQCLGTDDATIGRRWKETRAEEIAEADRREGRVSAYAPAPRPPGQSHTVWSISPASSGVETYVPALMTYGVLAGRISIERLVEVACENNAKAFALYPRKGALQVGADADLNVIDPKLRRSVVAQPLPQNPGEVTYNFLEGRELAGWPVLTMVRGTVVARDGDVVGKPGNGRLIERTGYPQPYPWWPR